MGFSAGGAIGPALAGIMVSLLGVSSALLVDAGTFALVALILAATKGLRLERSPSPNWRVRLRSGLNEARARPAVRRLLSAEALALIFFTAVVPIEVVYAKRTLGAGDAGYGALLASWGVGMVLGSVAYAARPRARLLTVLVFSTALVGFGYAGIGLAPNLTVACIFSAIGGLGNGAQWIAFITAVQQSVSPAAQSSVMSLVEAINKLMPAVGFLLGGVVATIGSPRTTYTLAAGGVLLVLLMIVVRLPPALGEAPTTIQEQEPEEVAVAAVGPPS
jgi:MFS family permease